MKTLKLLLLLSFAIACNSKPEKSAAVIQYEQDSARLAQANDSIQNAYQVKIDSTLSSELQHVQKAEAIEDSL